MQPPEALNVKACQFWIFSFCRHLVNSLYASDPHSHQWWFLSLKTIQNLQVLVGFLLIVHTFLVHYDATPGRKNFAQIPQSLIVMLQHGLITIAIYFVMHGIYVGFNCIYVNTVHQCWLCCLCPQGVQVHVECLCSVSSNEIFQMSFGNLQLWSFWAPWVQKASDHPQWLNLWKGDCPHSTGWLWLP